MNELTKKILKAMGLTDAQITAMDGDAPTAVELEITQAVTSHQRTLLENDSEFLKPIRDKAKTEIHVAYEKALKKNGIALTAEDALKKSPEEKIALLAAKAVEGKDKTVQDLEAELMTTKTELQTLKEVEIPKLRGEVDSEKASLKVTDKLMKEIIRISKDGKDLRNPIDVVEAKLNMEFGNKYKIELDEKGESLIFKDKVTGLAVKNPEGTKLLGHEEILKEALSRNKFLAESNADDSIDPLTGKKKIVTPLPGKEGEETKGIVSFHGMGKAELHLEEMKKKAAEKAEKAAKPV